MSSTSLSVIVLAAGLGTRMKSSRAKVLHHVCGRPMIEYPIALARALGARRVIAVLGHQLETVQAAIDARFGKGAVEVVRQAEQRGTGHALLQAEPLLTNDDGLCLVLSGDVPLLTEATLRKLVVGAGAQATTLLTFEPPSSHGYGRVVRDEKLGFVKIVEEKDATDLQRRISEVNAGIYCGPTRFFMNALSSLTPNNAQGELYLTDVLAVAAAQMAVHSIACADDEVMGVNDRVDLAHADRAMRARIAERHQRAGVTISVPDSVTIEPDVEIGQDVELGAGVELRGRTFVGAGSRLDTGVVARDTRIGQDVHVKPYCVLSESVIGDRDVIGPWAHLRPGTELADEVHLGNFVETKKTRIGRGSKANHLSYLGDAEIGAGTNIGCGTITCNYDGFVKYKTIIGDRVFVGSDTQLVAPVRVGDGASIGAGTTVYEDVPADALALTRPRQITVAGWAAWKRASVEAAKTGAPPPPRPARPAELGAIGAARPMKRSAIKKPIAEKSGTKSGTKRAPKKKRR